MLVVTAGAMAWITFSLWIARSSAIVTGFLLAGGPAACMILYTGWSSYKWKRDRYRSIQPVTTASAERPALMSLDFLKPEPLKLAEFPVGEPVYVDFTDIAVDLERRTWVDLDSRAGLKASIMSFKVERKVDGTYRLTIPVKHRERFQFTPRRLYSSSSYAAVSEICEADLDYFITGEHVA